MVSSAASAVGAGLGATGEGVCDDPGDVACCAEGAGVGDKVVAAGVGAAVGAPAAGGGVSMEVGWSKEREREREFREQVWLVAEAAKFNSLYSS